MTIGVDDEVDGNMWEMNMKKNKFVVCARNKHENAPETERFMVDEKDRFFFDFTQTFACLGSTLTFLLSDVVDACTFNGYCSG